MAVWQNRHHILRICGDLPQALHVQEAHAAHEEGSSGSDGCDDCGDVEDDLPRERIAELRVYIHVEASPVCELGFLDLPECEGRLDQVLILQLDDGVDEGGVGHGVGTFGASCLYAPQQLLLVFGEVDPFHGVVVFYKDTKKDRHPGGWRSFSLYGLQIDLTPQRYEKSAI